MNREQILFLIYKYKFTAIEALIIQDNFQNHIIEVGFSDEQILTLFDSVVKYQKDDFISFQIAELKNKITQIISYEDYLNSVNISIDDDDFDENFEDEEEDQLKWASKKEKERVKKLEEYLEKFEDEYILKELADFIYESYPNTFNEINRFFIGEGCRDFLKQIGTENTFYLSKKSSNKWRVIENSIDKEIELRKYSNDKINIQLHKNEYLEWATKNSIQKHTKQNIKLFLKHYGTKLSENIIDEIKVLTIS